MPPTRAATRDALMDVGLTALAEEIAGGGGVAVVMEHDDSRRVRHGHARAGNLGAWSSSV